MGFYPNFGSESPEEEFYASAYLISPAYLPIAAQRGALVQIGVT